MLVCMMPNLVVNSEAMQGRQSFQREIIVGISCLASPDQIHLDNTLVLARMCFFAEGSGPKLGG